MIAFDPATGILTLTGGPLHDWLQVLRQGASIVASIRTRDDSGRQVSYATMTFPAPMVRRLIVKGYGGNDTVVNMASLPMDADGGAGQDTVYGGNLADTVQGGSGVDVIWGYGGNDRLSGGTEGDLIRGGDGSDTLMGGPGKDRLYGGEGGDVLQGGTERDTLAGEGGNDTILDATAEDTVIP